MSRIPRTVGVVFIIIAISLNAATSHAATEYATFSSFYKPTLSPMIWIAFAAAAAVAVGAVAFSGGTASPAVAAAGTWVGNLMGYSGIAATNAGLALLGGGSIVSGGTGIAGGVALLTAALTFGTEVVINFGTDKILAEYSYSRFADASKEMASLPLPKNTSGPNSYKKATKILEDADSEAPISSEGIPLLSG